MKEDNIITLKTYQSPMLAEIIRGRLEANGIPCFIANDDAAYSQVLGVQLRIFEKDKEKCLKILEEDEDLNQ